MYKKSYLSLFLVIPMLLCSCKKELEPQESIATPTPQQPVSQTAAAPQAAGVVPQNMQVVQQQQMQVNPQQQVQMNRQQQPVTVAAGMNPPHGQPNHRCDIAVGMPLNSPPGKPATPQMQQQGTQLTQQQIQDQLQKKISASNPNMTVTPAVMNAEGKLVEAKSTGTNANTPAILNPGTAATATAPGTNPAHGQPGHRCDVAVGAPLPKS